jgi:flagellar basal body P-ring formation protein FlgA
MNMIRTRIYLCALAIAAPAALLAPSTAHSQAIQSLESIVSAASQRLHEEAARNWHGDDSVKVEISVGRLDGRLRLPACAVPLETELPPGARPHGAVAVGVRCTAPGWSLFVPARVTVSRPVVVMAVSRPRGATLSPSDLVLELRDLAMLPGGYLTDPAELAGMSLRRAVQARTVLLPGHAAPPELVRRGERVTLQAAGGTIAVQVEGEALASGALGERVRVRNLATRRVVEGTVGGEGLVVMGGPGVGRLN